MDVSGSELVTGVAIASAVGAGGVAEAVDTAGDFSESIFICAANATGRWDAGFLNELFTYSDYMPTYGKVEEFLPTAIEPK
jgi:hypothetical protein